MARRIGGSSRRRTISTSTARWAPIFPSSRLFTPSATSGAALTVQLLFRRLPRGGVVRAAPADRDQHPDWAADPRGAAAGALHQVTDVPPGTAERPEDKLECTVLCLPHSCVRRPRLYLRIGEREADGDPRQGAGGQAGRRGAKRWGRAGGRGGSGERRRGGRGAASGGGVRR